MKKKKKDISESVRCDSEKETGNNLRRGRQRAG